MPYDAKPEKKSPLKDKPLRLPGQSSHERFQDVTYDRRVAPLMILIVCAFATALEVLFWVGNYSRRLSFFLMLLYTLLALAYVIWSWVRSSSQIAALKLGRDGERAVAEVLAEQVRRGNTVFHDIVGPSFNLDHVIVAPQGIFVIETKTISKPSHAEAVVTFDGTTILVDGRPMTRNPIDQTHAEIRWLREVLHSSTGLELPVKGIVVFPGWFVKSDHSNADRKVWVMNPKGVDGFISAGRTLLPPESIHMAAFHLSRFIRSSPPS